MANAHGYSGTPLATKLGLKPGTTLAILNPPPGYRSLVGPALATVTVSRTLTPDADLIHVFETSKPRLASFLEMCLRRMKSDAAVWVSWPKRTSGVATDITEDTIRELALPMGLVDVKVCAVDATWSGLKLMIRREKRPAHRAVVHGARPNPTRRAR